MLMGSQWLQRECSNQKILWCSSAIPLKDRDVAMVQPFEDKNESRFLVSTKRLLGTGVTLTRAFRSVNCRNGAAENALCRTCEC